MKILVLIELTNTGTFRARVDGATASEAASRLEALLRERFQAGGRLGVIDVGGPTPMNSFNADPLPDTDWFFQTMRDAIAKHRQREDSSRPQ